jgi:hypothetical protein
LQTICRRGGDWFASFGRPRNSGTKVIFCVAFLTPGFEALIKDACFIFILFISLTSWKGSAEDKRNSCYSGVHPREPEF